VYATNFARIHTLVIEIIVYTIDYTETDRHYWIHSQPPFYSWRLIEPSSWRKFKP